MPKSISVASIADLQAYRGINNQEVYCTETRTRYRFYANGVRYFVNSVSVISSIVDVDARWVAVSGRYEYKPELDPGILREGDLVPQRQNLESLYDLSIRPGTSEEIIHVEETKTSYRYVSSAPSIPVNGLSVLGTSVGGDTRWIGVEGPQTYVNLTNYKIGDTPVGFDLDGNFNGSGSGTGNLEIQSQSVTVKIGPTTLNFIGPNVTAQETVPGSGVVDIFIGTPAPTPSFNITSFTVTPNTLEVGQALNNPTFNYATSPTPATSLTINQGVGAAPLPAGPFTPVISFASPPSAGSLVFNMLGTLTSYPNANASATVSWRNKIYWGAITNQAIVSLGSLTYSDLVTVYGFNTADQQFATSRAITKTLDASGGRYIFFLYPTSFGLATPQLQVGPFPVTLPPANINTTLAFTNESGGVVTYTLLITDIQFGSALTVTVL